MSNPMADELESLFNRSADMIYSWTARNSTGAGGGFAGTLEQAKERIEECRRLSGDKFHSGIVRRLGKGGIWTLTGQDKEWKQAV